MEPSIITLRGEAPEETTKKLNHDRVEIYRDSQLAESVSKICPLIVEWRVKECLFYKDNKNLLKEIENIRFPLLRFVNIRSNAIESMEGFSRIYMPMLDDLYMIDNKITNGTQFSKCYWPLLNDFALQGNLIKELDCFTKMEYKEGMMKELSIDWDSNKEQSCDVRWLLKMKPTKIYKLAMNSSERIKNSHLQKVLNRKYKELDQ